MRYYHPSVTTYETYEAPDKKSPLEWRPSLEKGEETHVRDCMTWHGPSPRYTYRNHNYRLYTHDGRDYWTARDCGNPQCRSCAREDVLVSRDVGYVRRNELGRTIYRGFSSKPRQLKGPEETGDYGDGTWTHTQRYEPMPDTARSGAVSMRDPFNRPIGDGEKQWSEERQWSNTPRYDPDGHHQTRYSSHIAPSNEFTPSYNNAGYASSHVAPSNDMNTYRSTFPRIDERDPGSVSYRPMGATAPVPSIGGGGYNRPMESEFDQRPVGGGGGGGSTYRSQPPMQMQPDFDSGYQGGSMNNGNGMNGGFGGGASGGFGSGGGGGGGAPARGNDAPFRMKDDPSSSMKKPVGPRRELKGPNTAVAFTV